MYHQKKQESSRKTYACAYDGTKYGHVTQIDDMIDAVIEGRDPQIMPLESIKTIKIIEAIYRSAKTGETVKL